MSLQGRVALVTGATGFLGGALALRLASDGASVRALARRPEKAAFLRDRENIELVQGDITDAARMREAAEGCDYVFHVAVSYGNLAAQRATNVEGTRRVVQAAASAKVARLVHVSSIAVYGYRLSREIDEATPPVPSSDPYVITKREAEAVVRDVASHNQLAYSIIRPGMIYGPRSPMWTGTLYKLARRRPTVWLGDGSGSTFPIHVDDVVDMMVTLATHPEAVGEAFNCVPDPAPTWREFLGAYSRLAGHQSWLGIPPGLLRTGARLVSLFARPQTQAKALPEFIDSALPRSRISMTKARELLSWQPRIGLETGIESCVPWLREQGLMN